MQQAPVKRSESRFACLTYHVIAAGTGQYAIQEETLRSHLSLLTSDGYLVDDFEGLEVALASNRLMPNRYVVLTVDDGHESTMKAAEILHLYRCKATFFVTRDRCVKKAGFIRPSQIRELRKTGFSLGAHGTTHRKLTFMPLDACAVELRDSKRWLEDVLGEPVRHMAIPGGYVNRNVLRLAYDSGYTLIGTCKEQMNLTRAITLPNTVSRVNVRRHFSLDHVQRAVTGHKTFYAWRQLRAAALAIPKQLVR
jgi:peptidoglycan/xylan/chitin deacetylase (PgdA/CDA1 family)